MKQYILVMTLAALFFGGATAASAQDATTTIASTPLVATTTSPTPQKGEMKLEVGPNGRVLIRGNVDSVGTDYVIVKSWGGLWKVKISMDIELLPKINGGTIDLSKFAVGDYVGAQGTVATDANWTINAKTLRDWNVVRLMKEEQKKNEQETRDIKKVEQKQEKSTEKELKQAQAKNWEGVVGDISGMTFAFTTNGTTLSVTTSSSTKLVNRNWNTITFSDMKSGDKVRVYGPVSSSTLSALIIRNLSVPR